MKNDKKISRRNLLKQLALSFSIPTILLWYFGTKKKIIFGGKNRIVIPNDLQIGVTFLDQIIIKKEKNSLTAFSSKCTHLGCKINSTVDDQLVCPCHGSKFNFDGIPQNGPATKSLLKLEIEKDKSTGNLVVYV